MKAVDNDSPMDVYDINGELEEVKKLLPASMIQACNTSFVQLLVM